tara:strand:- start:22339 stop:22542 length:204 start_codon:yes stop_codon:yes gene_type:complete
MDLSHKQLSAWHGRAKDFSKGVEFALAAEGLNQKAMLIRAGYANLRAYVDNQLADIKSGHRKSPTAE